MTIRYQQLAALGDFAGLIQWEFKVLRSPRAINIPVSFNTQMLSTDVPKNDALQSADINVHGIRVRQPGIKKAMDTITLTFAETVTNNISALIAQWDIATYNPETGVAGSVADVKGDFVLIRQNRQHQAIWVYEMYGVYLEDYDPTGGQLDGENPDIARPTLTLSIDRVVSKPA